METVQATNKGPLGASWFTKNPQLKRSFRDEGLISILGAINPKKWKRFSNRFWCNWAAKLIEGISMSSFKSLWRFCFLFLQFRNSRLMRFPHSKPNWALSATCDGQSGFRNIKICNLQTTIDYIRGGVSPLAIGLNQPSSCYEQLVWHRRGAQKVQKENVRFKNVWTMRLQIQLFFIGYW